MSEGGKYILFMVLVVAMFLIGVVLGTNLARQALAHDVCVTLSYDTGKYTQGQVVCGYRLDVPLDELAPYFVPEESGMYWSEEGQAL